MRQFRLPPLPDLGATTWTVTPTFVESGGAIVTGPPRTLSVVGAGW